MSENNKQLVMTAYQRIFGDLDVLAVDQYLSKDFIQHNPTTPDGPEGVKQLLQMLISQGVPKQKFDYKHALADGDTVMLHTPYQMGGTEWRFIDIYRVENGKLVEHWDAMMQMPETPAHNNPLF